jgi:hypothetical protein
MSERRVIAEILLACSRGASRLFRINAGRGWTGRVVRHTKDEITLADPRPFHGAPKGFPDIIGWQTIEITADMVGQRVAVAVALEAKSAGGRATPEQRRFIEIADAAGARAAVVRSAAEAVAVLSDRPQNAPAGLPGARVSAPGAAAPAPGRRPARGARADMPVS